MNIEAQQPTSAIARKQATSIFSTITRHPGLFKNYYGIDYNAETTFARVTCGMESAFRWECAEKNIPFLSYPPNFKL